MKPIPPRPRFLPPMERPELGAADSILVIYSTGRCPFCVKKIGLTNLMGRGSTQRLACYVSRLIEQVGVMT